MIYRDAEDYLSTVNASGGVAELSPWFYQLWGAYVNGKRIVPSRALPGAA
jgi:hypothetical protein